MTIAAGYKYADEAFRQYYAGKLKETGSEADKLNLKAIRRCLRDLSGAEQTILKTVFTEGENMPLRRAVAFAVCDGYESKEIWRLVRLVTRGFVAERVL